MIFAGLEGGSSLRRLMRIRLGTRFEEIFRTFEDLDPALQWCEDRLLARLLPEMPDASIAVTQYSLLDGLSREEVATVHAFFERRTYEPGDTIIRAGDPARELFLLSRGLVSVFLPLEGGGRKRLATFSPGMAFGEMAIIDRAPRSATDTADTAVSCDLLSLDLCRKLRKANREIALFV